MTLFQKVKRNYYRHEMKKLVKTCNRLGISSAVETTTENDCGCWIEFFSLEHKRYFHAYVESHKADNFNPTHEIYDY